MKILLACEESQIVCKAFRERGHEAYSCDLLPCSGGHPEWHLRGDVFKHIYNYWDVVISFPPCTDIAVSGAKWFDKKRLDGSQKKSLQFFFDIWRISNCTENPIGILNKPNYVKKWYPDLYRVMINLGFPFKPDQIIHPWMFGDNESKATCLWLKGLPILLPTHSKPVNIKQSIWRMSPGPDRGKLRSKTFPGIAKQMAVQWG